jgi:hypothetical protein
MPIRHRRDVKTINSPSIDEISIGEIVINAKTGKLYIVSAVYNEDKDTVEKQSVIEFTGKVLCQEENIPEIEFSDVSNFCCFGDTLSVEVSGLDRVTDYDFAMVELTANSAEIDLEIPRYSNYMLNPESNNPTLLRSATIPVNINVNKESSAVSVFKFGIEIDNTTLTEKVLSIRCKDCGTNTTDTTDRSTNA